jgi:alpha-L-fucosidase
VNKMITDGDFSILSGPFQGNFESLRTFQCPDWFKDAKFGIWAAWGPQSVPMYGDWYARNMYVEGSDQYNYHCRKYGHPSEFGYKDIISQWKAEKFDPEGLMKLFVEAGAQYFAVQAMHHDNFDNFDSKYQPRFNSVVMGPKRDIVGEWQVVAKKYGLPFGISEHLAASYGWFASSKGCDVKGKYKGVPYDGNDPEYGDLYYEGNNGYDIWRDGWITKNEEFHKHWFLRIKDLIDKYKPDMLYSDSALPFEQYKTFNEITVNFEQDQASKGSLEVFKYGLDIVAHLYNTSAANNNGKNKAVYTQKLKNPDVFSIGVLDIERSQENKITENYWQTDTSVGDWFYNVRDKYKPWNVIMETLIDVASKNGNLLLDVTQKPDGTLDFECEYILKKLGQWMSINSEGIFGTRHWRKCSEGVSGYKKAGVFEENAVDWKPGDVRFTYKDNTVYGFLMRWPGNMAIIRSLPSTKENVSSVTLLGYGNVEFKQNGAGLIVSLPDKEPSEFVSCIKISLK